MYVDIYNTDKKYKIIYADPPWEYKESGSGKRVVKAHYPTMNIKEIMVLPVPEICDETSILFLFCCTISAFNFISRMLIFGNNNFVFVESISL